MTTHTENYQLDSDLTLRDSEALLRSADRSQSPLTVRAIALSLTKQDDKLIECRLTLIVNPELYKRIDTDALFNLKREVRGSFSAGKFQPEL